MSVRIHPTAIIEPGVTLVDGAISGCNLVIGRFAMVGMRAVVTRSVPDFHLVIGNPARSIGCVCRCGEPLLKWDDESAGENPQQVRCDRCGWQFEIVGQ